MSDQRLEFVLKALDSRTVFRELCQEYAVSAKTGYKWLARFRAGGQVALDDQSRRPHRHPDQLSEAVVCELVKLKLAHRTWGPRKIQALYLRTHRRAPSESSVKRVLDRAGLVEPRRRRQRPVATGRRQRPAPASAPNQVWTVDFNGWWLTPGRERCEPLTIRDEYSRYLLALRALTSTGGAAVREAFEQAFRVHGLPQVIRSDNGSPFACTRAPFGLSRLSAWFLALGIDLDRIAPGHPEQNGGHERMHLDIRRELQRQIGGDLRTHQAAFDLWRAQFNHERPHDALGLRTPAELYHRSERPYDQAATAIDYPGTYLPRRVTRHGTIRVRRTELFLTTALSGWDVGLEPLTTQRYALWFDHLRLGEVDLTTAHVTWADSMSINEQPQ